MGHHLDSHRHQCRMALVVSHQDLACIVSLRCTAASTLDLRTSHQQSQSAHQSHVQRQSDVQGVSAKAAKSKLQTKTLRTWPNPLEAWHLVVTISTMCLHHPTLAAQVLHQRALVVMQEWVHQCSMPPAPTAPAWIHRLSRPVQVGLAPGARTHLEQAHFQVQATWVTLGGQTLYQALAVLAA